MIMNAMSPGKYIREKVCTKSWMSIFERRNQMRKAETAIEPRRERIFFLSMLVLKGMPHTMSIGESFLLDVVSWLLHQNRLTERWERTIIFPDVAEKHR
jgi:hypothetical protein